MPSESLRDEDRFSDFSESEASLIAKQARSELLDQVANFCELERGDPEDQRKVMGMNPPAYHDLARASINNNNNNNNNNLFIQGNTYQHELFYKVALWSSNNNSKE